MGLYYLFRSFKKIVGRLYRILKIDNVMHKTRDDQGSSISFNKC